MEQKVDHTNSTDWLEHIDYNERFTWAWQQGRFGFGPYGKFPIVNGTALAYIVLYKQDMQ